MYVMEVHCRHGVSEGVRKQGDGRTPVRQVTNILRWHDDHPLLHNYDFSFMLIRCDAMIRQL
jgi:hypothetical protein